MKESMPIQTSTQKSGELKKVLVPPRPTPKEVITVTDDDFIDAPEMLDESDFMEVEDEGRPSGTYETFESPRNIQEQQIVEAMTFPNANGIEGGVTLQKKRERNSEELNEDCVIAFEDKDLGAGYGSFDGLGSEGKKGAGALASAKAVEVLPGHLIEAYQKFNDANTEEAFAKLSLITLDLDRDKPISTTVETYQSLEPSLKKKAVAISEAFKKVNEDVKTTGGKTTACFTLIHTSENGKRYAITANIGDSGALRRREDGTLSLITKEDSALNEAEESGVIPKDELEKMKADPRGYKFRGVTYEFLKRANTQALGGKAISPKITIIELASGDEIYNVTDGILDFFETEQGDTDIEAIKNVLNKGTSLKERMEALREVANARSKVASLDENSLKDSDDSAISAIRYAEAA